MPSLAGKRIIITGAGAGIGQALATGFVREGAIVHAVSRSQAGLDLTHAQASGPGRLTTEVCDVTDAEGVERVFGRIAAQGSFDLLVNNAAVYPKGLLGEMDPEAWRSGMDINVNGVAMCCRAAIRTLARDRRAVIFNVGSFAYLGPEPGSTLYCTSKAAVSAFTRALTVELAASGSLITVHEWIPGVFRTRMSGNAGEDPALAFERLVAAGAPARAGREAGNSREPVKSCRRVR